MQAGMLEALYERGILADVLVATSLGAFNAAFVASRPQTMQTSHALAQVWGKIGREDIFPVSLSALVGGVCGNRDHIVPDRGLRQLVRRNIELDELGGAATPLHVLAFDIDKGREALLSAGPAVEAVCAAASIPGVLPPVAVGEHRLIDGTVADGTPISHAVELGAERIYVLGADRGGPRQPPPRSALDAAMYGLSLMSADHLDRDLTRYRDDVELIVLPSPDALHVQPSDFAHASGLVRDARSAARQRLALTDPADWRPHRSDQPMDRSRTVLRHVASAR
jgi:NTE family protein